MENHLQPFWSGDTVHGESLFFVKPAEGLPEARLLFTPSAIVNVESATGETEYAEGKDYIISGDTIRLPEGSRIPFMTQAELDVPANAPGLPGFIRRRGQPDKGMLFSEGDFFHRLQTCVTYRHQEIWYGAKPGLTTGSLPRTLAKLKAGQTLVVGVSGDSISAGANASKCTGAPPFQPAYPELVTQGLAKVFGGEVRLINRAVGGWSSADGIGDAAGMAEENPDLAIIAYGMNDNLHTPAQFLANIRGIMEAIRKSNPEVEFILVAGMCGNTDWQVITPENFPAFREGLKALTGHGVALADVTTIWIDLLRRKSFLDLSGNGVNHPNDFAHRIYAQTILSLFGESVRTTVPGGGGTRLP